MSFTIQSAVIFTSWRLFLLFCWQNNITDGTKQMQNVGCYYFKSLTTFFSQTFLGTSYLRILSISCHWSFIFFWSIFYRVNNLACIANEVSRPSVWRQIGAAFPSLKKKGSLQAIYNWAIFLRTQNSIYTLGELRPRKLAPTR